MSANTPDETLRDILWARSVAIVGASSSPQKLGHIILKNILDGGYRGSVYPINPGGGKILGLDVYTDLDEVPDSLDLVIFCIPAKFILPSLQKAATKGARGAIIISGGFREIGNQALETQVVEEARRLQVRLIGPNCQGINFTPNHLCATWPLVTKPGSLAVISQSGTIAASMAGWAESDSLGLSGAISLGNQADLCETDFLEAFGQDEQTHVIAMYIEGVRDGRRFMAAAHRIDKPIVVLKSGRTPGGIKAAASHTKSLAGSDQVFTGICQQLGINRVDTTEELYDVARGFAYCIYPQGNRLAVITSSGGSGILAVDAGEQRGLKIPELGEPVREALTASAIPGHAVLGNPLDLTGSALSEDYLETLRVLEQFNLSDMYLLIFGDPIPGSAEMVGPMIREMNKPVGICYLGGGSQQDEEIRRFQEMGIPVYATPERAVCFLAHLTLRAKWIRNHKEKTV